MIIKVRKPIDRWVAVLDKIDGFEGIGKSPQEAIGFLICQLAASDDSISATDKVDVRII